MTTRRLFLTFAAVPGLVLGATWRLFRGDKARWTKIELTKTQSARVDLQLEPVADDVPIDRDFRDEPSPGVKIRNRTLGPVPKDIFNDRASLRAYFGINPDDDSVDDESLLEIFGFTLDDVDWRKKP